MGRSHTYWSLNQTRPQEDAERVVQPPWAAQLRLLGDGAAGQGPADDRPIRSLTGDTVNPWCMTPRLAATSRPRTTPLATAPCWPSIPARTTHTRSLRGAPMR